MTTIHSPQTTGSQRRAWGVFAYFFAMGTFGMWFMATDVLSGAPYKTSDALAFVVTLGISGVVVINSRGFDRITDSTSHRERSKAETEAHAESSPQPGDLVAADGGPHTMVPATHLGGAFRELAIVGVILGLVALCFYPSIDRDDNPLVDIVGGAAASCFAAGSLSGVLSAARERRNVRRGGAS
jgi:hypothetical protein